MKIRWILLIAVVHFAATFGGLILWQHWVMGLIVSANDRQAQVYINLGERLGAVLLFPAGLLNCGGMPLLAIISMVLNSLFWGWAIMGIVVLIRRWRTPVAMRPSADRPDAGVSVRVFLIQLLVLAVFCFALTPVAAGAALFLFAIFLVLSVALRHKLRKLARAWTEEKQTACFIGGMAAVVVAVTLLMIVPWPSTSSGKMNRAKEVPFGEMVSRLRQMQESRIPFHLMMNGAMRWRTDFDVNRYFTVLDRIEPQPGYTLDYVYHYSQLGGWPIIYARRTWAVPFLTASAFRNATGGAGEEDQTKFLMHIKTDGTPEGFVQFVLLSMLADQFYLYWHAGYNDTQIVYGRLQLDELLTRKSPLDKPTAGEIANARTVRLDPLVELDRDVARVTLVTWTDWGGLYRKTFAVKRRFPHRILDKNEERIYPYDCGIVY